MTAEDIRDFAADHTILATGSRWLPNLCGANELPSVPLNAPRIYTPTDLANGATPEGPVAVFDFDNYALGTAIAEDLHDKGHAVTYITTAGAASAWTFLTNEQPLIHQALARRNIGYHTLQIVTGFDGATLHLAQIMTGEPSTINARSLIIVGQRLGGSPLQDELADLANLHLTGDACAPGAIAHAIWQGHRTARDLGNPSPILRRDAAFATADMMALQ